MAFAGRKISKMTEYSFEGMNQINLIILISINFVTLFTICIFFDSRGQSIFGKKKQVMIFEGQLIISFTL